jgi:hypothetical protein
VLTFHQGFLRQGSSIFALCRVQQAAHDLQVVLNAVDAVLHQVNSGGLPVS